MYCKNCGKEVEDGKEYCADCEAKMQEEAKVETTPVQEIKVDTTTNTTSGSTNTNTNTTAPSEPKSKMAAGLLGIFLGQFGVHNFYLGYTKKAVIQVSVSAAGYLLSFCTFGISCLAPIGMSVWGLVEGIMILAGSIKTDGNGTPLKE